MGMAWIEFAIKLETTCIISPLRITIFVEDPIDLLTAMPTASTARSVDGERMLCDVTDRRRTGLEHARDSTPAFAWRYGTRVRVPLPPPPESRALRHL